RKISISAAPAAICQRRPGDAAPMRGSARIAGTRTPSAGYIDLGNEPPLSIGEAITGNKGEPIRRAVSLRWLSGTVLTGFMSLGLMGGALVAALNGSDQLAAATPQP